MFRKQQDGDHAYRNLPAVNQEMLLHKTLSEEVQGKYGVRSTSQCERRKTEANAYLAYC